MVKETANRNEENAKYMDTPNKTEPEVDYDIDEGPLGDRQLQNALSTLTENGMKNDRLV